MINWYHGEKIFVLFSIQVHFFTQISIMIVFVHRSRDHINADLSIHYLWRVWSIRHDITWHVLTIFTITSYIMTILVLSVIRTTHHTYYSEIIQTISIIRSTIQRVSQDTIKSIRTNRWWYNYHILYAKYVWIILSISQCLIKYVRILLI